MSCFMCKGDLINELTSFVVDFENCIIIIKNVPTLVCIHCGAKSYDSEVGKQILRIANIVKSTLDTEIAVVNYSDKVA